MLRLNNSFNFEIRPIYYVLNILVKNQAFVVVIT